MNNRIFFDVGNFWHLPNALDDGVGEATNIAFEMSVVYPADTSGTLSEKRILFVGGLEEVEMIIEGRGVEVVFQRDDV